jgi:alpha-tubulin suppressor-like RCC1 family protein
VRERETEIRLAAQIRWKRARRHAGALGLALIAAALTPMLSPAHATADVAQAWGANNSGQLGNGTNTGSDLPVSPNGVTGLTAVSAGAFHSLALIADGTVLSWGEGTSGQLGDGAMNSSDSPVTVKGLGHVVAVAAGAHHSLALRSDGSVMAWGANRRGQLGDGSTEGSDLPVPVVGLSHVVAVSAGADHSLALLSDGSVVAWGYNGNGQLGDGSTEGSDVPVPVSGLRDVIAVSAGADHSLALLGDGSVMAWGANESGQLGNGTEADSDVPVLVPGLSGASAISAGGNVSLAELEDGTLRSWGGNAYGQLGDGTSVGPETCGELPPLPCSKVPTVVGELRRVAAFSAGKAHSLALLTNGRVMAWGENNAGQLGVGTTEGPERCAGVAAACSATPLEVRQLISVSAIAAGGEHSLAIGKSPPPPTTLPELGRCVRVRSTGGYSDHGCVVASRSRNGSFEWLPGPGTGARFTLAIPAATLETLARASIACASGVLEGQWNGPKTASINIALRGCVNRGTKSSCETSPNAPSEITTTSALEGQLGLIVGGSQPEVGLDLKPTTPTTPILAFTCGGLRSSGAAGEPWTVEGSVIGQLGPIDKMRSRLSARYGATAGAQLPEFFEGSPPDTPSIARAAGPQRAVEPGSLTMSRNGKPTILGATQEPLEIKAKQ